MHSSRCLHRYEAFYVQNSFWKPFWDIMPPNYDHMPSNGAYTQLYVLCSCCIEYCSGN